MDAEQYLIEVVGPTIEDFEKNPTSRRHGFLAAVSTFHTIDYMSFPGKSSTSRQDFRRRSKAFRTVDRVAHAFKHVHVGRKRDPLSAPLSVADAIVRPPMAMGEWVLGLSRLGDSTGGITLNDDRDVDLLESLKHTVEFFHGEASRSKV